MITLATISTATEQEIFDQAKNHLLTQKEKAQLTPSSTCRYRLLNANGKMLKCAAGCLISDDEYSEDMEYHSWNALQGIPKEHSKLITELQQVHDINNVDDWKSELRHIARVHKLVF